MLKQRLITALILGLMVLVSIYYLPIMGFCVLSLGLATLGFWEFWGFFVASENTDFVIAKSARIPWQSKKIVLVGFITLCLLVWWLVPTKLVLAIGGLWWLIAPYFLWRYSHDSRFGRLMVKHAVGRFGLGAVIFLPFFLGLITLKEQYGSNMLLYLLAIICAADVGAYFVGRWRGKHLLAAMISPKKTIEGALGGLGLVLVLASFYGLQPVWLGLVVVVCIWSIIGDLFESMLKRIAGIKDSGKILPGHGGIYDRLDSLTAAVPIFALIMPYLGR